MFPNDHHENGLHFKIHRLFEPVLDLKMIKLFIVESDVSYYR